MAGLTTMSYARLAVKPKESTITQEATSVKLPGFELWMNYDITNVFVVPARIDVASFVKALSETLSLYPHAAGRLVRSVQDEWEIVLCNSAVPVEVAHTEGAFAGLDRRWVLQRDLSAFQPTKDFTQPTSADEESRLLLVKLTLSEEETAIAISWHHVLGDAFVIDAFMRCLSQQYQGGNIADFPAPDFTKRVFDSPSPSLVERYSPLMPHFTTTYPMSEVGQYYASMNTDTSWVNFKISVTRLRQLKARVVEVVEHATPISAQDVLTAYITIVLNRYLETPITVITNVISYHNVPQVVHSTRVAGNALCIIPTIPIQRQPFSTISETAVAVRQSILMCRDPTFVEEYMTVASTLLLAAANRNHSPFFEAFPGKLAVNSHATIDRRAAHFGFPDTVQFYAIGLNDRYVRVFKSNPTPGGQCVGGDNGAGECLDVFFAVASKIRDQVMDTIEYDLHAPDFPYNINVTSPLAMSK